MLDIVGLRAGYEQVGVLAGLDLSIAEGGAVVLTGPNGHGKTTLLRVISGLLPSWEGEIHFDGKRIDHASASSIVARGLIHVPQGDLLYGDLTVERNLLMGAYLQDAWRNRRQRLSHVYDLFPRLRERRNQRARTLSGGERRMVGIGRGLMGSARLLMVDEPALGLAPVLVREVYAALADIASNDATVLIVDETLANATQISDRACVMEGGRIVLDGPTATVAKHEALRAAYVGQRRPK
jgi:branched-chain amino acid transport system ATP-binding protein